MTNRLGIFVQKNAKKNTFSHEYEGKKLYFFVVFVVFHISVELLKSVLKVFNPENGCLAHCNLFFLSRWSGRLLASANWSSGNCLFHLRDFNMCLESDRRVRQRIRTTKHCHLIVKFFCIENNLSKSCVLIYVLYAGRQQALNLQNGFLKWKMAYSFT